MKTRGLRTQALPPLYIQSSRNLGFLRDLGLRSGRSAERKVGRKLQRANFVQSEFASAILGTYT